MWKVFFNISSQAERKSKLILFEGRGSRLFIDPESDRGITATNVSEVLVLVIFFWCSQCDDDNPRLESRLPYHFSEYFWQLGEQGECRSH